MSLPRRFFEPSFRYRHLGLFLAAIVGAMVYMATFVTAAEASLSAMTLAWDKNLQSRMTVELPAVGDEAAVSQVERIKQAMDILRAIPGVAHITVVGDDEAERLLKPWIEDAAVLKALPVPALIDIDRAADSPLKASDIQKQLRATLTDVRVTDNGTWLADLAHFVDGLAAFGALIILLAALTLTFAIVIACRSVMATERDTISLLHIMGAEDDDIAKHFEAHARHLTLPSAIGGFAFALVCAAILLGFMRDFADPLILGQAHWIVIAISVLLVPATAIWIVSLSARLSALSFLRGLP